MLIPSSQFVFSLRFTFLQPGNTFSLPEKGRVNYGYKVHNLSFRRMKSKAGRCGLTPGAVGLSSSLQLLTITSITSHLLRTLHYNASHIHVTSITSLHAHYITARHIFIDHCGQLTICITLYIPPLPKYPVCSAPYNTPYIHSVAKMTSGRM